MADVAERIAALEAQIAFLEDSLASLDAALASQQQQILTMDHTIRLLHTQLKDQGQRLDAVDAPAAELPPHY